MLKTLQKIFVSGFAILVVLFAVLLTLARIGSLFAPNFVPYLNGWFAEQNLEFSDLKIKWRGINPVVELGSISSSNLLIEGITAELDTLSSFSRNTYAFRTIQIEHVSFEVTQSSACTFDFPNVAGGSLGVGEILRYTDNIDVSFSSSITCGSTHAKHEGFLRTLQLDNVYRLHASIQELGDCSTCSVSMLYEATAKGYWRRTEERLLNIQAHDFVVPVTLLGWDFIEEPLVNAQILMNGTSTDASLVGTVDFQPTDHLGESEKLFLDLGFALKETESYGKIVATLIDDDQSVLSTVDHLVLQDLQEGYTHGWSDGVDADSIRAFMSIFGVAKHPIHEWAIGLTPTGNLSLLQWLWGRNGFTYGVEVDEFQTRQYAGFPALAFASASIAGHGSLVHVETMVQEVQLDDERVFSAPLSLSMVDLVGIAAWDRHHLGCSFRGAWIPASATESVDFRIGMGEDFVTQQRWFRFALEVPRISTTHVQPYVESFVSSEMFQWIDQSINSGHFDGARVKVAQISNNLHEITTLNLEVRAPFVDAEVTFYEDWPEVVQGSGELWLTQDALEIEVDSAYSHGNHIEQGKLSLPFSDSTLEVSFVADMTLLLLQSYLVESPLLDKLPFDPLQFDGTGAIDLEATLMIPLTEEKESLWDVKLDMVLADVSLDVKQANVQLDDMFGSVGYQFPKQFTSSQLTGKFFEEPVTFELNTRNGESGLDEAVISFKSNASIASISHLTGEWLRAVASGSSQVSGEIVFPLEGGTQSTVDINTNLVGVALTLPEPFHKKAELDQPVHVHITLDNPVVIEVTTDQLQIHTVKADGLPLRGSVGINMTPQELSHTNRDWLVTGNLSELVFASEQLSDSKLPTDLSLEFNDLHIEKLVRGQFQLHNLMLDGTFGGSNSALEVSAEEGTATLARDDGEDWQLSVEQLRLWYSAFDTPADTPLDPTVFLQLPALNVEVKELYMFDENGDAEEYGSWNFAVSTNDQYVHLQDIVADFRGVNLDSTESAGIVWDTDKNETRFEGTIKGNNLLTVLPAFDVAAEVESKDFTVNTDLTWPGSPFDINPLKMSGRIHGDANTGTLLEVGAGQGILRLLSVFNIAPIIQRMDFDPTAMFSRGFNFDRILFDVSLASSQVIIQEPIHIKGRSSEIRFSGTANLADESLNMDVVVQLPLTNNLKWYVALITGNPTAFLGTIIGSRIFRTQLDRISSAKYKVEGTFETPDIELIGVFEDDLTRDPTDDDTIIEE